MSQKTNHNAAPEQLRKRVAELEKIEQKHKETEAELKAANQQLDASNQRLQASEQEIRKSKERAESYLNIAAEIILSLDNEGNVTLLNESGHQLLGYKNGELIGKNWFTNCLSPKNIKEIRNVFNQLIIGELEKVTNFESSILTKSGEIRTIIWHSNVLKDEKGKISGTLSSGEDITERKKAEEKIELNEERFRKSQEAGHIGSWEFNLRTNEFWGSDEGKRIYNLDIKKKEFSAEEVMNIVVETDREKVNQAMIDLVNENKPYNIEFEIIPKNTNKRKIINSIAELQKDKNGKPHKVTGVLLDITKEKLAEQKIKENESFLKAIYENSLNAIVVSDDKGNYISVNDAASELLGYPKEQLLKINVNDLQTVEEKGASKKFSEFKMKGKDSGEFEFVTPNGVKKTALYAAVRVKKDFNLSILSDITERKQAELELIQAKEKAEEADQLKSAFLANMSHEIRTPMNGIIGFTNLLKDQNISGEQHQKFIDIIQKSGNRMLETVDALIDISRIETGQVNVAIDKVNVNSELNQVVDFLRIEANQKGLNFTLEKQIPDAFSILNTDKQKLNSVFTNLINNAIKYTDSGYIKIGLELKANDLHFYVKDSGIGVPKGRQQAIFNRFEQADIKDSRAFQGSGLGLAIVKAYVEMLNGEIGVDSEEGKGSTFWVKLPVKTETQNEVQATKKISKPATLELNNLKILIAEDDEFSKKHLVILLEKSAREILFATDGAKAIELCKKHKDIDLILMDIKMPQINGYDATREIRKFNSDIAIIAQTAYALSGERDEALRAGCNEYISKPIEKAKLFELIKKILYP